MDMGAYAGVHRDLQRYPVDAQTRRAETRAIHRIRSGVAMLVEGVGNAWRAEQLRRTAFYAEWLGNELQLGVPAPIRVVPW